MQGVYNGGCGDDLKRTLDNYPTFGVLYPTKGNNRMKKTRILLLYILLLASFQMLLWAQASEESAMAAEKAALADSINVAVMDSLIYVADSLAYNHVDERIYLWHNSSVFYEDSQISADSMYIDLKKEQAFTYGPTTMKDGDQILLGRDVAYDVRSQTGYMWDGLSRIEKSYYGGAEVRKVGAKVYDVDSGRFTTCDLAEPDFWFTAGKLRIYQGDKLVGKPVVAWVNNLPVFYFPFLVVPIRRGRHPGFLIPEPGYNNVDGKFLREIAWYYPYKDYADFILSMDLMEKTGWKAKLNTTYTKRYLYDGFLRAAYQKQRRATTTSYDWSLRARHHHDLGERAAFDADLDFISNKRIWESSGSLDENLAERLSSSMSYRQPLLGSYLNVGATYTQDLVNDQVAISLPSAGFSMPSRPVYELFGFKGRTPPAWFANLSYSYSVRLDHTGQINDENKSWRDYFWSNRSDSTQVYSEHHAGIRHNLGLNYSLKPLSWLNTNHSFSYGEAWFDRDRDDKKWVRGNDYSFNTAANFNLYGIRNFSRGKITSIRHIVTPSASLGYRPDFEENRRFYSFGGIAVAQNKASLPLSLGLEQKWQLKYKSGGEEKRINDIFGFSSRASADLKSKEKKFQHLAHSLAFRPGDVKLGSIKIPGTKTVLRNVGLTYDAQMSFNHNPYEITWQSLALKNQYFTHKIMITGSAAYKTWFTRPKNRMFSQMDDSRDDSFDSRDSSGEGWKLSLSQDISASKNLFKPENSNLHFDASLKVSKNWQMTYSNYYDLKKSKQLSQSISLSRDLHCWKLELSYSRRNEFWEYRLVLFNMALPDALRFQTRDSKRY